LTGDSRSSKWVQDGEIILLVQPKLHPICKPEQTITFQTTTKKSEYEIKLSNKEGIEKQVETFLLDKAEEATKLVSFM
jgi:hypothetical protein